MQRSAFYCVADERYFLGAVGLVNSLRLVGHTEPIYLLDCGLAPEQRELISPEVTLVRDQSETPPWLLKTIAPLRHPAEVMVLIDADMVVTRRLDPLIEQARTGKLVAAENDRDRFCAEWSELLGLTDLRRGTYLSSGLVVCDRAVGGRVLDLMHSLQDRVDFGKTFWRENAGGYPFLYADQDVFNPIVHSEHVAPAELVALDHRLAPTPPFTGLKVVDEATLTCRHADGIEPYVVHHFATKPWLENTFHGAYSRLLRRALVWPDIPVKPPFDDLPLRLRTGARALAARKRVNLAERWRYHVREPFEARVLGRPKSFERPADQR